MSKKSLFGILALPFVLVATVVALIASPKLVTTITNQLLPDKDTTLTCLDYEIRGFTRLSIKHVCVSSPSFELRLNQGVYSLLEHRLDIEELTARLLTSSQGESDTNSSPALPAISIPSYVPAFRIEKASLETDLLASPLVLKITQPDAQRFKFTSSDMEKRLEGLVLLTQSGIQVDIKWHIELLKDLGLLPSSFDFQPEADNKAINSRIALSGSKLSSEHLLDLSPQMIFQDCVVKAQGKGKIKLNYHLTDEIGLMDLSALTVSATPQSCRQFNALSGHIKSEEFFLTFPSPLLVENHELTLDSALIKGNIENELILEVDKFTLKSADDIQMSANASLNTVNFVNFKAHVFVEHKADELNVNAEINAQNLEYDTYQVSEVNASISSLLDLSPGAIGQGQILLQAEVASSETVKLNHIDSQLVATVDSLDSVTFTGETLIEQINFATLTQPDVKIDHRINANLSQPAFDAEHIISLADQISAEISHVLAPHEHKLGTVLPEQSATALSGIASQLGAQITSGSMSGQFNFDVETNTGTGQVFISDLSGQMNEYKLYSLTFSPEVRLDSGQLQLIPSSLEINQLDAGVKLDNITVQLASEDSRYQANDFNADLLGGTLVVENAWLDRVDQTITLRVRDIDLQSVMNVQQDAGIDSTGISLSGRINGDIPLQISEGKASISLASLINSTQGTLKITGNTGFETLKAQQPEIGQQLAFLEHVEFDTLSCDLSMESDGLVFFDMKIKGVNPEHNQPINFNYTHQQNVFTLMRSLRLADQIEKNVQKHLSGDN